MDPQMDPKAFLSLPESTRHAQAMSGPCLWQADGRKGRQAGVTYREALHATYTGPYTRGRFLKWDALVGNAAGHGQTRHDPVLGFDLTMPAGQATDAGYTTRDIASAPHGIDYQPHFVQWTTNRAAHPNLMMPGRTAIFHGVRFPCLALGDALLGTGGCILQDWVGLDFDSMEKHSFDKERYIGTGLAWLPPQSEFGRLAAQLAGSVPGPFTTKVSGVAPILVTMSRTKDYFSGFPIWLDPKAAYTFAIHWTPDAQAMELWLDGRLLRRFAQGDPATAMSPESDGRIRFQGSGLHVCCWQDNNNGGTEVAGYPGNPDQDQVFTIERLEIRDTCPA